MAKSCPKTTIKPQYRILIINTFKGRKVRELFVALKPLRMRICLPPLSVYDKAGGVL